MIMTKTTILLVLDVWTATRKRLWPTPASSLATTSHVLSSLPWLTAPSLLYRLLHPPSEVLVVEEVRHHEPRMAAHLGQEEVNFLEIEPLAHKAFLMANGDEAKECPNTPARVELVVANVSVNVEEAETGLIEPRDRTSASFKNTPLGSYLASPTHTVQLRLTWQQPSSLD